MDNTIDEKHQSKHTACRRVSLADNACCGNQYVFFFFILSELDFGIKTLLGCAKSLRCMLKKRNLSYVLKITRILLACEAEWSKAPVFYG